MASDTRGETAISRAIVGALDDLGIPSARQPAGRFKRGKDWIYGCPEGWPDRVAIVDGRVLFVEVKRVGGKVSPEQEVMHARLRKAGAVVVVASSVREVVKAVREMRRES